MEIWGWFELESFSTLFQSGKIFVNKLHHYLDVNWNSINKCRVIWLESSLERCSNLELLEKKSKISNYEIYIQCILYINVR